MADPVLCDAKATSGEPQGQREPLGPPITPQELIDVLIDIDLSFERKCNELSASNVGATLQYHRLEKLRVQHDQKSEPYVQRLMALQDELKTRIGS